MIFEAGHIYHIFNQGNNGQKIFYTENNYLFFREKIREHILPFADVLAWCLMPNHFHLMVLVNEVEVDVKFSDGVTGSRPVTKRTLNNSLGIMLRSYTRAINKQENRSGSLFREETKAVCLTKAEGITPAWFTSNGITQINITAPEKQYPQVCFDYIHNNPVKDGLAGMPGDWEFSSYREYAEKQEGALVSFKTAREFELIV